jgi:hypothetical protein
MVETVPIRADIFERAFKRYQKSPGASFNSLAKKIRVPAAQLREWRRNEAVPADKLEALADALGLKPQRLMRTPDGVILDDAVAEPLLPGQLGHNLLTVARTMRSYTRFLGYHRIRPDLAHSQSISHAGRDAFYATLFIEASAPRQAFIFSVWFGLRMDYGEVRVNADGEVELEPILQEQDPSTRLGFASETEEGKRILSVRTWFGRARCDYILQSDKPFQLRWTREPVAIPGAVTFVKNPFQKDE